MAVLQEYQFEFDGLLCLCRKVGYTNDILVLKELKQLSPSFNKSNFPVDWWVGYVRIPEEMYNIINSNDDLENHISIHGGITFKEKKLLDLEEDGFILNKQEDPCF